MSSSKTTWLALLALGREELPAPEMVTAAIAKRWPLVEPPALTSETAAMATFAWGEATIAYTLVPRPIPHSQLTGPVATAWYWPDAAEALRDHAAHLIITLVDEGRDAIAKSTRLTQFTTALADCCDPRGILWAPAGLVHEPAAFAQQADQLEPDDLPLYLWIDFRIEPADDDRWRLFTTGLEAFERRELEADHVSCQPQELLETAHNVAHYALTNVSPIKDNDTIGLPDGRQIVATREASVTGDDRQVLRLRFDD